MSIIRPDEIRSKAQSLYRTHRLDGIDNLHFFPRAIAFRKQYHPLQSVEIIAARLELQAHSKAKLGLGYRLECGPSRNCGGLSVPRKIIFETRDDLLHFIGRFEEFLQFEAAVKRIREHLPQLDAWLGRHHRRLPIGEELEHLITAVDAIAADPQPNRFTRELSLSADTKFIENHQSTLREWLDLILPPWAIRSDEKDFCRRYGFRYQELLIPLRFLDQEHQRRVGELFPELFVRLPLLASQRIAAECVLIVENAVTLRTLPPIAGTLAIGGLGNSVTRLQETRWLHDLPSYYWGDLDCEGLRILSNFRILFRQTTSLMMDSAAVERWKEFAVQGNASSKDVPPNLTEDEAVAYQLCRDGNLRIEQERLPPQDIRAQLTRYFRLLDDESPGSTGNALQSIKNHR